MALNESIDTEFIDFLDPHSALMTSAHGNEYIDELVHYGSIRNISCPSVMRSALQRRTGMRFGNDRKMHRNLVLFHVEQPYNIET
jgi:hypothetical protein